MSDSPELGRHALARAETMRSPRAAEALRRAVLVVEERNAAAWESSEGRVRAVDVRVLLDGSGYGLVRGFPAVGDAVVEAITAVAPEVLGASVIDLAFEWALKERIDEGYRDHPPLRADRGSAEDVRRALAAFLAAIGDEVGSLEAQRIRMRVREGRVEVRGKGRRRIERALDVLLAP